MYIVYLFHFSLTLRRFSKKEKKREEWKSPHPRNKKGVKIRRIREELSLDELKELVATQPINNNSTERGDDIEERPSLLEILEAHYQLGMQYRWRIDVEPLLTNAATLAKRIYHIRVAADQGDAESQFNLGVCYENGEGVEQSL